MKFAHTNIDVVLMKLHERWPDDKLMQNVKIENNIQRYMWSDRIMDGLK